MKFWNELSYYLTRLRSNFENKRVLQNSFLLQIIAMIISNSSFFVIWIVFNKAVGTINGWGPLQTFGMLSVSIFTYGITHTMFGSLGKLYEVVPTGIFDTYLTKPKSLYLRIINNEFNVTAIGDLVQGFGGIVIYLYLAQTHFSNFVLLFLMIPAGVLIEVSILILYDCVIFWLPQASSLSQALFNFIMLPSTQPISLLKGSMRFIYLFIIPALVIGGLPVEAFNQDKWRLLGLTYTITIAWFFISRWVLTISIRRYESGNSIG
jgi:ABC-2 type transport system permease protein